MGCEVWDLDANRYIEYGMGLRSVILGHAFPSIIASAEKAMQCGAGFVRPSVYELECAETMLSIVPTMDMIKFSKNGSDVTTAAVRLARAATGANRIAICRDHPFFSTDDWFIGTTPMDNGIPEPVKQMTSDFPYGNVASLEELLSAHPGEFACVIMEPEKYEPPPPGYLQGVRDTCDRHGVCLIFDEMITGFRHHLGGVHLREEVTPDLVTYGKCIANGFANSALMGRRELMELGGFHHNRPRVFLLSTTHGAETHALAATIETMRVLQSDNVVEAISVIGRRLAAGVQSLTEELGIQDHFGVTGFPADMVYFTKDAAGNPSQEFRTLFLQESMERGLLAPSLVLSYSHTAEIIDETLEILASTLEIYARALNDGVERYLRGRPVQPAFRRYR